MDSEIGRTAEEPIQADLSTLISSIEEFKHRHIFLGKQ